MDENWELLMSLFPPNWEQLAFESGAMTRMRKLKSPEALLRTLLLHVGHGYSMRETVARAKEADIADFSDVALLKRLKKSGQWFYLMCLSLLEEQGVKIQETGNKRQDSENSGLYRNGEVRLFDSVNVQEPGKTGSLWKVHYSLSLPSLDCNFFNLSELKGKNPSFFPYPVRKDELIIADSSACIHDIASKQGFVTVDIPARNLNKLSIYTLERETFPLLEQIQSIKETGEIKFWDALFYEPEYEQYPEPDPVKGRVCAIRKSKTAIKAAHAALKAEEASEYGAPIDQASYEFAKYIVVFTTFPEEKFSPFDVLEWYRLSWQLRPVLKRFKDLFQIGHLPKYDDESSKAWFYGKLFVALLMEKLQRYAEAMSPWGYIKF